MVELDNITKTQIVKMILGKQTEKALEKLSEFYHVTTPQIAVGTIKGKRRTVYALYIPKEQRIYALNSDIFFNPFVILHEYYHHIRSKLGVHRGSERNATSLLKSSLMHTRKVWKFLTVYNISKYKIRIIIFASIYNIEYNVMHGHYCKGCQMQCHWL
jgi:hypothetical protein